MGPGREDWEGGAFGKGKNWEGEHLVSGRIGRGSIERVEHGSGEHWEEHWEGEHW